MWPSTESKPRPIVTTEIGSIDPVEAAREVDNRFGEQPAEQLDLLLLARAAGMEVLPEGLVLDVIPADPRSKAQATAGQEINVGRLPCHEGGLALRKDEDPGGETDSFGDAGQIGEHHERVVEWVELGVGPGELGRSIGVNGAEHVVVGEEVVKAHLLDGSADPPNCGRIASKLVLRVDNADLHRRQHVTTCASPTRGRVPELRRFHLLCRAAPSRRGPATLRRRPGRATIVRAVNRGH
jgi:hypothetical protein